MTVRSSLFTNVILGTGTLTWSSWFQSLGWPPLAPLKLLWDRLEWVQRQSFLWSVLTHEHAYTHTHTQHALFFMVILWEKRTKGAKTKSPGGTKTGFIFLKKADRSKGLKNFGNNNQKDAQMSTIVQFTVVRNHNMNKNFATVTTTRLILLKVNESPRATDLCWVFSVAVTVIKAGESSMASKNSVSSSSSLASSLCSLSLPSVKQHRFFCKYKQHSCRGTAQGEQIIAHTWRSIKEQSACSCWETGQDLCKWCGCACKGPCSPVKLPRQNLNYPSIVSSINRATFP